MGDDFLTRTSFAGVPHTLPHSSDTSQATIYPISPQMACKLYWMLSALTVSYTYSINGTQVTRNFSAASTVLPKNRLVAPAVIYTSEYDSQLQMSYTIELSLDTVYFDATDNSKVGFKLMLSETDGLDIINLGLQPMGERNSVSLPFTFLDEQFTAYLNYDPSFVTSATLTNFTMVPQFFTI